MAYEPSNDGLMTRKLYVAMAYPFQEVYTAEIVFQNDNLLLPQFNDALRTEVHAQLGEIEMSIYRANECVRQLCVVCATTRLVSACAS